MAKILIVDDEELIRDTLKDILEHEGYKTDSAADGEQAADSLRMANRQQVRRRRAGRKADDGEKTDLEVNVVGQPAQCHRQQRADDAQRHHQDDGKRNGPAFIQRG